MVAIMYGSMFTMSTQFSKLEL